MNRRERFLLIAAAPLVATSALFACSDDDARPSFDAPETGPDSSAHLPETGAPLDDAGAPDVRAPIDASDEPVVCTAQPCVTQLVAGTNHFCALLDDKTVRCWGSAFRAMGDFDAGGDPDPAQATPMSMGLEDVEQISAGNSTTCARRSNGTVTCWGGNGANELGLDPPTSDYGPHGPAPVAVGGGALDGVTRVDVGTIGAVFAVRAAGKLWSWGDNAEYVLGRMNDGSSYLGPGPATELATENVRRAGGGGFRGQSGASFAITEDGRLLTWGTSAQAVAYPGPIPAEVADLENVSSASMLADNMCAVADGRLYCWGLNGHYACSGSRDSVMSPLEIRLRGDAYAQQVSISYSNTCVKLTDGTIECCGSDDYGQLARGITDASAPSSEPLLTEATAFTAHAVQLAVANGAICALVQGGTVQCWGTNQHGELGQGTRDTERHSVPVTVNLD